jgi:hypothetical protein
MTRTVDVAKPGETSPPPEAAAASDRPAPVNFIISIDGEEHPIQLNNPIVLQLANKSRKIILKPIN